MAVSEPVLKLSAGPIPYFWERRDVLAFYHGLAGSPVDIVYLGEVICSKRRLVTPDDWLAIGRDLKAAGKEVVLSSLTLIEAASEIGAVRRLCENEEFIVEANDTTAIQMLSTAGRDFVTGPGVNIYNPRTLAVLAQKGLKRWVLPVELGLESLRGLQARRPAGVETEVFALGRLPLAYSARCYTARSHNLPKDRCEFKCLEYPDGRVLKTREGEAFLTLNGIQTQSALTHETLEDIGELQALGVDVLRISPQSRGTVRILELFDQARKGADAGPLREDLHALLPVGACNGYVHGQPGMAYDDSTAD